MNIEARLAKLEKRVAKIEDTISTKINLIRKNVKSTDIEALVAKIDAIGTQDLVVIALRLEPKQTKPQIMKVLEDWGKAVGNWFQGGNFNSRLIKKGIVKKVGVDKNNDVLYSLTKKGELIANEFVSEIRNNNLSR